MPLNDFTVGRDQTISISTPTGVLNPSLVTKFTSKQDSTDKKVKGMDGITRNVVFPDGWSGTVEVDRQDSSIDDQFAQDEANYYAGQNQGKWSITQTILEKSGVVSQYQFTNAVFKYDSAGDYAGDDTVHLRMTWMAERRIKLS